ncbi:hypothetical protein [Natrinema sp. SYSU A 869]|uniref:hypothetical protein n=1 Tax=Natrinema sp. SYSU A 869 TaxID=2871694 RepID=UPI001CA3B9DD|nr:hypothetical protein [Natrinema sp. SYSU A 869]
MDASDGPDPDAVSPLAWRLLRVAAGYDQRAVEREIDELVQAHLSMLESGSRSLSRSRRQTLLELYGSELTGDQVRAVVDHF